MAVGLLAQPRRGPGEGEVSRAYPLHTDVLLPPALGAHAQGIRPFTRVFFLHRRNTFIVSVEQPEASMEEGMPCSFCAQKNWVSFVT